VNKRGLLAKIRGEVYQKLRDPCRVEVEVNATYKSRRILRVMVLEGYDARNPENWLEITSEKEIDSSLMSVGSVEEVTTGE